MSNITFDIRGANIALYNMTNSLLRVSLKKDKLTFQKLLKKIEKEIDLIYEHYSKGSDGSLTSIASMNLYQPFIFNKIINDFTYWINEIQSYILKYIDDIASFNINSRSTKYVIGEFKSSVRKFSESLPTLYNVRDTFLKQRTKKINEKEKIETDIQEWKYQIDNTVDLLLGVKESLIQIIGIIDLLEGFTDKIKNKVNVMIKEFVKDDIGDELVHELKVSTVFSNLLKKMTEYSVIRFADVILITPLIVENLKEVKGVLWK